MLALYLSREIYVLAFFIFQCLPNIFFNEIWKALNYILLVILWLPKVCIFSMLVKYGIAIIFLGWKKINIFAGPSLAVGAFGDKEVLNSEVWTFLVLHPAVFMKHLLWALDWISFYMFSLVETVLKHLSRYLTRNALWFPFPLYLTVKYHLFCFADLCQTCWFSWRSWYPNDFRWYWGCFC